MINSHIKVVHEYLTSLSFDELETAEKFVGDFYDGGLLNTDENEYLRGRINDLQNKSL